MYDLTRFTLRDMTECGAALRKLGLGAECFEEVAGRIVHFLYSHLGDKETGEQSCVLVRFFKTQPFAELTPELRDFARKMLAGEPESPAMRCLTLLATAGVTPEWNTRSSSAGHQAIPLASEKLVAQAPMISRLIQQFGLEISAVLKPDPTLLVDLSQKTYNVFHVMEAAGSPYVPAQDEFVIPYGVRSVLGFGGMLPTMNLFAVILFSRVPIPRETADLFKTLSLSAKIAVLPFSSGRIFTR
jgi:hypothetical protein